MTKSYFYGREISSGLYNIDNEERVDLAGSQIRLAEEIENAFPDKIFHIRCYSETAEIIFQSELSSSEIELLDEIVGSHKLNL